MHKKFFIPCLMQCEPKDNDVLTIGTLIDDRSESPPITSWALDMQGGTRAGKEDRGDTK